MINREQILEMLNCYGANLAQWPCDDKDAITTVIENDAMLSEAFLAARQLDQSVTELFELSEPAWPEQAENRLSERIIQQLGSAKKSQRKIAFWARWNWLAGWEKRLVITPALPVGMAVLVLLAVVQLDFKNSEQPLKNSQSSYSMAELDEWLIFEGLKIGDELLAEREPDDLSILEGAELESSLDSELIFYL